MPDVDDLNRNFGKRDAISFALNPLGGIVCHLAYGANAVVVALQGAQVLSWTAKAQEQLWLSPVSRLGTGKAVRGGIPVCWPWFGPHPDDAAKPAHGFVRTRDWRVEGVRVADGYVALTLATGSDQVPASLWPHACEVRLTVRVGDGLSLSLETRNAAEQPILISQALHTYFAVEDCTRAAIEGLDGVSYLDKMYSDREKTQKGAVMIDREVDRIYFGATDVITLRDGKRVVSIASTGSRSAVVWNPWIEKTLRLGDMGAADAYRRMLCIETANAGPDARLIAPGERHVIEAHYRVA